MTTLWLDNCIICTICVSNAILWRTIKLPLFELLSIVPDNKRSLLCLVNLILYHVKIDQIICMEITITSLLSLEHRVEQNKQCLDSVVPIVNRHKLIYDFIGYYSIHKCSGFNLCRATNLFIVVETFSCEDCIV